MTITGTVALAARSLLTLPRIALDAMAEPFAAALPMSPERIANPAVLNAILREYGTGSLPADVSAAQILDVPVISSNCNNVMMELDYASEHSAAPTSIFVKLPCEELSTRLFCNVLGVWRTECFFCQNLAAKVPIRVPAVHAVASRGTRFVQCPPCRPP